MNVLIIKLGATGDVVRTTTLLRVFQGPVTWITSAKNRVFVDNVRGALRGLSWEEREQALDSRYDLIVNLEDEPEVSEFAAQIQHDRWFGAQLNGNGGPAYSEDSQPWFDMSLISRFGRAEADRLKSLNRCTYQEIVFRSLGLAFREEPYYLPPGVQNGLKGDVAIAPEAGAVWPMKRWAYYNELRTRLEQLGLKVNLLGTRASMLEHLGDVQGHRCLVSGDTLPMHLALGSGIRCVSIFTCTSPWEIHDYGLQEKIVSPLLEQFFYKRGFDERATTAIEVEEVFAKVMRQLEAPV